jgi:hypothetical protein
MGDNVGRTDEAMDNLVTALVGRYACDEDPQMTTVRKAQHRTRCLLCSAQTLTRRAHALSPQRFLELDRLLQDVQHQHTDARQKHNGLKERLELMHSICSQTTQAVVETHYAAPTIDVGTDEEVQQQQEEVHAEQEEQQSPGPGGGGFPHNERRSPG